MPENEHSGKPEGRSAPRKPKARALSTTLREPGQIYQGLMHEAKIRIEWLKRAWKGELNLADQIAKEFCYLQLRHICELIAVASVAIHKEIADVRKLEAEWNAQDIMKSLSRINPNFFPVAVTVRWSSEPPSVRVDDLAAQPMDKAAFFRLYAKCGEALHLGALRKIVDNEKILETLTKEKEKIRDSTNLLIAHFKRHRVSAPDNSFSFVCELEPTPGQDTHVFKLEAKNRQSPPNPA